VRDVLEDDESSIHILCDCEAVAYTRFGHLVQYFMDPSDYYGALIDKVLLFIRSVRLIKGKHNRSLKVAVLGPVFGPPLYIHTYVRLAHQEMNAYNDSGVKIRSPVTLKIALH
jgi:hypothetical protein